jgi:hypothetical protein
MRCSNLFHNALTLILTARGTIAFVFLAHFSFILSFLLSRVGEREAAAATRRLRGRERWKKVNGFFLIKFIMIKGKRKKEEE